MKSKNKNLRADISKENARIIFIAGATYDPLNSDKDLDELFEDWWEGVGA